MFDFHTHLAVLPDKYEQFLQRFNIERAVLIPYNFNGIDWETLLKIVGVCPKSEDYIERVLRCLPKLNEWVRTEAQYYPQIEMAPWVSVVNEARSDCDFPVSDVRIVKFIPVFDHCVTDEYYEAMERKIKSIRQKIVAIHTGWGASPDIFTGLIDRFSNKTFVLMHMKEDFDRDNLARQEILKEYDNVYLETSYAAGPHRIKQYYNLGFHDRMLFGSDWRGEDTFFSWQVQMIMLADIPRSAKRDILHDNAVNLLASTK